MYIGRFLSLGGMSLLLLAAQAMPAQSETANPEVRSFASAGPAMSRGVHFGLDSHLITGEPYSAVRTTTFVQTLTNSTTINRSTTTKEARDSSGRIYRETQRTLGNGSAPTFYDVVDPVNRVITSWRSDSKQASVTHLPDWSGRGQRRGGPASESSQTAGTSSRHRFAPTVEQLGTKTVAGVDATGTRSTMTFPAGTFGNNQPVTVTHERWISPDLGLLVLEIDSDPRSGVRTTSLADLQRSEPEASLFQPPQGYTITERTRGQGFRR